MHLPSLLMVSAPAASTLTMLACYHQPAFLFLPWIKSLLFLQKLALDYKQHRLCCIADPTKPTHRADFKQHSFDIFLWAWPINANYSFAVEFQCNNKPRNNKWKYCHERLKLQSTLNFIKKFTEIRQALQTRKLWFLRAVFVQILTFT